MPQIVLRSVVPYSSNQDNFHLLGGKKWGKKATFRDQKTHTIRFDTKYHGFYPTSVRNKLAFIKTEA